MMGRNRALLKGSLEFDLAKGNCVFISHKKEDEEWAKAIGDYLMQKVGVDIYLDFYDIELKEAVNAENDRKIIESINKGIGTSSHLLCLVSDKTKLSWWVPYEVGMAEAKKKKIATLKFKGVEDIPSFLKTQKVMRNMEEFFDYTKTLEPYGDLLSKRKFSDSDNTLLHEYIDF